MQQLTLTGPEESRTVGLPELVRLRKYQSVRSREGLILIDQGKNPILEMATGTGKTATAADIIRHLLFRDGPVRHRILWLVHRIELVHQAAQAITRATGVKPGFELPEQFSTEKDRIVVASKDTVRGFSRLMRMQSETPYTVIFTDEAHHSPGKSYQVIYDAWPKAARVGMTATVDRLDRQELESYNARITPYTILDGITDSWLVPFRAKRVKVRSVDLSNIGTVAGDLNQGQLDAVIRSEESLHGIAKGLIEHAQGPTIVFATGVDSGERLAEILGRYRPLSARFISGSTPDTVRARAFKEFGRKYQFLVNVGIATEGTDLPAAQTIAMVRSTKSRSLFSQMLGRGGRPLPGLDEIEDDSAARAAWIANSAKPFCLVLDFVGNTGKHNIVTAADVLGIGTGNARIRVKKLIEQGDTTIDVLQAIRTEESREQAAEERRENAKELAAQERAKIVAKSARIETIERALIGMGGIPEKVEDEVLALDLPASPGQVSSMQSLGVIIPPACTRRRAKALITMARVNQNLATQAQIDKLSQWRLPFTEKTTKVEASRLIGARIRQFKTRRFYG